MRSGILLLCAGCATAATRDHASSARKDADGGVAATTQQDAAAVVAADAPVGPVTAFYPVAQGACPAAQAVVVGRTPILHFAKAAWAMEPAGTARAVALQPKPVYSMFTGTMIGESDRLGMVGGLDEEHLWFTVGSSSGRGEDGTSVVFRGKYLKTPTGEYGFFGISNVLQQPDGSIWAYGNHSMYLDIPGDAKIPTANDTPGWRYNRWFAWSKEGTPLTDVNLPMGDMEKALRLDNGELVSAGVSNFNDDFNFRRWSPTRKVNDFPLGKLPRRDGDVPPEMRVGSLRAVMRVQEKAVFYSYISGATPEKLAVSPLGTRAKNATSWLLTKSDELWVATDDAKLFIETKDGTITEETLPERGRLAKEPSAPWFMGSSGAVYARTDGPADARWRKIELPDGLWSDAQHPANVAEWVAVVGPDTWVSTVRTDKGFGFRNPSEIRTFYSSKARASVLRCGSPFETSMLFPLPPKADASCKDLVVVLGRERNKHGDLAIPYAKIAGALKGDAALGDTLSLGIFGKAAVYGIHAPSREAADAITKKLAHLTLHEPELVCGAPDETRHATLDVKAGTFTSIPDAGAK